MRRKKDMQIIGRAEAIAMSKLRAEGWSIQEIADHYGITPPTVMRLLRETNQEIAKAFSDQYELRILELQRLDEVIRIALSKFREGDPRFGNTLIKAIELQADLMGLRELMQVDRTAELVWKKLANELGIFTPYTTDPSYADTAIDTIYEPIEIPQLESKEENTADLVPNEPDE